MRTVAGLLFLGLLGGCGWSASLPVPGGGTSVGVEVFPSDRRVLERDLEPILNTEISRAVVDYVDVPIASPRKADVVVRGRILQYHRRSGVRNKDNELLETGLFIEASAELVDGSSGEILTPTKRAHIWSGYTLDDAVRNELVAKERGLRHIAETLVLELFRSTGENVPAQGE